MTRYRVWSAAAVALALFAASAALAQDTTRRGKDDRGDKGVGTTGAAAGVYTGRIARVDADKRTLVLGDIMTGRGGRGGTGGTGTGGAGKRDTGTGGTAGSDRGGTSGAGRTGAADKGGTAGAGAGRMMTFTVSDKARISLDGKEATFAELKSGLYARVHTERGSLGGTGTGAAGKDRGTSGGTTGGARDKGTTGGTTAGAGTGAAGRAMTATRIEAFTRAPAGTGTGTGTGRGTGTGGTTRPGGTEKKDR